MRVKICCISSLEEANLAMSLGATALGLVGPMPSGPGIISNELIREIAAKTPKHIDTFLLTSETEVGSIVQHHKDTQTNTLQMVDWVGEEVLIQLRNELPDIKLVQVVHVLNDDSIQQALRIAPFVDALLLDSGNPNLLVKELGGTGRKHDWSLSQKIRKLTKKTVYLAGGLKPKNIQKAIQTVKPQGVDVCSGVRTNGSLDEAKLKKFMTEIKVIC